MKILKPLFFGFMLFSSFALFGQSENALSPMENGNFEIPETTLKDSYTLNVSFLGLESFATAIAFFSEKSTDLILFRPNASGSEVTVFLQLEKKPDWSISDWNNALTELNLFDL